MEKEVKRLEDWRQWIQERGLQMEDLLSYQSRGWEGGLWRTYPVLPPSEETGDTQALEMEIIEETGDWF